MRAGRTGGKFLSEKYIQHKPVLPNGRQAVVDFIQEKMGLNPRPSINIKHIMAEGDLVTVHSHVTTTPADGLAGWRFRPFQVRKRHDC